MSAARQPRVFNIPAGVPFLPALADAFLEGRIVAQPGLGRDPLAAAGATIYVPTRRAARELRSILVERGGGVSAILPTIRPLGEFEEDLALFEAGEGAAALDLAPPMPAVDRLLVLAPLVKRWKSRLPAEVASLYDEEVVVPASTADAIWFARDLAALMDQVETEGGDWARLKTMVEGDLARWWQLTLEFLRIVTEHWPAHLAERGLSDPAAHRNALIDAETARLKRNPPSGPVIAAGSTGSIPATSRLLAEICRLGNGAVVLPGLDRRLDEATWKRVGGDPKSPSSWGHPQGALKRLLAALGVDRADVADLARPAQQAAARALVTGEALRPADTTEVWAASRGEVAGALASGALDAVTLIEAPNEREEAAAIALALREAVATPGRVAALVTGDRGLARRVSCELRRFGIVADDSGGTPLMQSPPGALLRLALDAALVPGDPVAIVALLKHPLLRLGLPRPTVREICETIDVVALRGQVARPDALDLKPLFESGALRDRRPAWFPVLTEEGHAQALDLVARMGEALRPLAALRGRSDLTLAEAVLATVQSLEALGRDEAGSVAALYGGDSGLALAEALRGLVAAGAPLDMRADEWPAIVLALLAPETVKPTVASDPRVHIWGTLEARLQSVDTLVVGALNEGSFPGRVSGDRFLSRLMKGEMELEPPERRIGQAAHDFEMACGAPDLVLSRAARAGDAPAVPSRWLQRLLTVIGEEAADGMRARGTRLLDWARSLDEGSPIRFATRPAPHPPLAARPTHFSVTEIERLRRDPYAVYARRVLRLDPLDPLVRDPAAAERGTLFHDILHRYSQEVGDRGADAAAALLLETGRRHFEAALLPEDVHAVWWPRFAAMVPELVRWDRGRPGIAARLVETAASKTPVGETGVTLAARADRIDIREDGMADLLDYKTGSTPSQRQAHTLVAPQLALEAALLYRGAFAEAGPREPGALAYVRLRAGGEVKEETILKVGRLERPAGDLAEDAWGRLERLLARYGNPSSTYLSRALPFKEGDTEGDYDHLARVLEWSAGGDAAEDAP